MANRWIEIVNAQVFTDTAHTIAMEISGVGCVISPPNGSSVFVPGARIVNGTVVRDDRTNPPLTTGLSAAEIRAKQPLVPDVGALSYIVEEPDY